VSVAAKHFGDHLIERARALGHPLCVGLDPHLDLVPGPFRAGSMRADDPATAESVERFLLAALERLEGRAVAVKPQSAFFEALGWPGVRVLDTVVRAARERGLLVVLDAKRGDVGSTAAAYAAAYLGADAPIAADALTVNPYLGTDALTPFFEAAEPLGRGLFVLAKTSNPGAGEFQDRLLGERPLFEQVARALADRVAGLAGPATGWSSLGFVVGANCPREAERLREIAPRAPFLLPGFGAQGGAARDSVRGLAPGPEGRLEGGIVSSSRGVLFPEAAGSSAADWERAFDSAIGRAIDALADAIG
jgi:orotidine-5'-phosphate decarboxylase